MLVHTCILLSPESYEQIVALRGSLVGRTVSISASQAVTLPGKVNSDISSTDCQGERICLRMRSIKREAGPRTD